MKITSIRMKMIESGALLAVVSVSLDKEIIIKNIKLIKIGEKRFLRMPYDKKREEIVTIADRATRQCFESIIFGFYDDLKCRYKDNIPRFWIGKEL